MSCGTQNGNFVNKCGGILGAVGLIVLTGCNQSSAPTEQKTLDTSLCQFAVGSCQQTINNLNLSLSIDPVNAPSETPITYQLEFSEPVEHLKAQIAGRDMFMGTIPLVWQSENSRLFETTASYGSCSSGYMVWRLQLEFQHKGKTNLVHFDFLADN